MSWLSDYLEYTSRQESPERFHLWAGITTCAAILGRRVWLDRRAGGVTRYRIYPGQLMVVLVGDSGRVRKTTALYPAKHFLKLAKVHTIGGKTSPEAFLDQLDPKKTGKGTSALLLESELSVTLSKQTYAESLIDVLTKLADAEDEFVFNTRGGGMIVIPKPCLTMLACTTPVSLGESLPPKAHGTGFLSRVIFVYERTTNRIEDLLDVEDDDIDPIHLKHIQEIENRLTDSIKTYTQLAGPCTFTTQGKAWMRDWYLKWVNSTEGQGEGWPSRRPDHMLRLAIILAITERHTLTLDEGQLIAADRLLRQIEVDLPSVFSYVGTTAARDRERIIEAIRRAGGVITSTALHKQIYHYFPDLLSIQRTMHLLQEAGLVQQHMKTTAQGQTIELWSTSPMLAPRAS